MRDMQKVLDLWGHGPRVTHVRLIIRRLPRGLKGCCRKPVKLVSSAPMMMGW